MAGARHLICTLILLVLAVAKAFATEGLEQPGAYPLETHPTLMEEVAPRRQLARGASDKLTQAASAAAGVELDFCLRLSRNMRRCVQPGPEGWVGMEAVSGVMLQELRLYGSVNRSERRGTAIGYGNRGRPIYIGLGREADGGLVLLSFRRSRGGSVTILSRYDLVDQHWSQCFVLDLTGNGRIDVALSSGSGVSTGGRVSVYTAARDGRLSHEQELFSAGLSLNVVDLNGDGIWELETSRFVGGERGLYYNVLHSAAVGHWRAITDHNRHAFRHQRRWYERYAAWLEQIERAESDGEQRTNGIVEDISAAEIRRLLRSWDAYSSPNTSNASE